MLGSSMPTGATSDFGFSLAIRFVLPEPFLEDLFGDVNRAAQGFSDPTIQVEKYWEPPP